MIRIPVRRDGKVVNYALVDDDVAEGLAGRRWYLADRYAVCRPSGEASGAMHRQICGLLRGDPRVVHHINENKLDNRRANLEVCASMSAANCRPHPKRDAAVRAGYEAWLARAPKAAVSA